MARNIHTKRLNLSKRVFAPPHLRSGLPGRTFLLVFLCGVLLGILGVYFFVSYAKRGFALEQERIASERLNLYAGTLRSALSKHSYLPHIIATNPVIQNLLVNVTNSTVVNHYLEDINKAAGSMELFVLDRSGNTVGTSNWDTPESFYGHQYHYRPYYQDAMNLGNGVYFAVGATTGRPGFFFAQAVNPLPFLSEMRVYKGALPVKKEFVGVAVAKVDLSILQKEWQSGGESVFITDEHGVIFLSSNDEWRYRSTSELPEQVRANMLSQRQYGDALPPALDMKTFERDGINMLSIDNQTWIYSKKDLELYGWNLWFLKPASSLTQQVEIYWIMGLGAVSLFGMLTLLIRAFYVDSRARREARESARIRSINLRLAEEVRIRKKTEKDLLAAQDNLLHTEHLAALGRVAASVAHELSQPVTSMRMFMSSCRRMAKDGHMESIEATLMHMLGLVQRLETLIGQLKHFSRKLSVHNTTVDLRTVLDNALSILSFKLEAGACSIFVECPEGATVAGDAVLLEQVCINLIDNALDALTNMGQQGPKNIRILVEMQSGGALLSIEDNGPGIDERILGTIFQPFFTTKKSGEGIGLGLSIVDKIVCSLHGTITVNNVQPHGTRFTIFLPNTHK